ncbi:transcriptional regulator [Ktedonobacter sp. SOSP1-52]|uniref:ROK family protein n=1 Tax=Ktedonobacter sp. SOSP1-52 TaxID=2778366 RepID=UPI001916C3EF|nr:ROK family protein [Ktedonobacter sp. SOSP1-52]GHO69324.1 transcriptional regulator [Ktedonobacter sp. SOSP1-52]
MSIQHSSDMPTGSFSTGLVHPQRVTDKLLATHGYVVGIEISSSGLRQSVALANLDGDILFRISRPLEVVPDSATVLQQLEAMLAEVTSPERLVDGRILRVGIAVGGLVDASRGMVRRLYHAHGWKDFPLQDYFTERFDAPCIIDNNANAAALAEYQRGAGIGERVILYVGLGRGIGGGLIINGKIYHGVNSMAGEIGHMLVKEQGPRCSCGGYGHLEAIASARAIISTTLGLSVEVTETHAAIMRLSHNWAERLTVAQVFQLADEGDQVAQRVVSDVHTSLGIALANIVHLVNPSMIILGGSVAQAGDLLVKPVEQQIHELCLPEVCQDLKVVQGHLGVDASLVGAVTLALQDL